ncbi:MAG: hypothetical protein ACREC8_07375 [Limisphaerales bacterium]
MRKPLKGLAPVSTNIRPKQLEVENVQLELQAEQFAKEKYPAINLLAF